MLTALRTRDSCVGNPIGGLSVWPLVANGCLALGNVSSSQQQLGPPVTAPDLRCQGPWPARRGSSLVFFQNPGLVVRSDSGSSQSAAFCSLGPPSSFRVPPPPPSLCYLHHLHTWPSLLLTTSTPAPFLCLCGNCHSKEWTLPLGGATSLSPPSSVGQSPGQGTTPLEDGSTLNHAKEKR